MKPYPGLSLYKNKSSGSLVIINFAVDELYGMNKAWGPMVHLTVDEFRNSGINIILDNLQGFADRDSNDGDAMSKLPRNVQRTFDREHLLVSIRQESPSQLICTPMHPAKPAGHIGDRSEEIVVNLPCVAEEFYSKLNAAFEKLGNPQP
jgi:hypothetical protein